MTKREKKIKPIVGFVPTMQLENPFKFYDSVRGYGWIDFLQKRPYSDKVERMTESILIPLDNYEREKADHKAQLREAARLLTALQDDFQKTLESAGVNLSNAKDARRGILKYLRSITADKDGGK